MDIRFYNEIESNPIIAAVKDMDGLHKAVKIDSIRIIFILFGDVCNIVQIVDEIKENNKKNFKTNKMSTYCWGINHRQRRYNGCTFIRSCMCIFNKSGHLENVVEYQRGTKV